ncbi:hypothetical protein [Demequina sp. NBRC 110054]|nr:hypothetical protein [Demequina sp. NBRC 110054]
MADKTDTTGKGKPTTGSNPLAYVLWALVATGLVYGVTMTAVKAVVLFTG